MVTEFGGAGKWRGGLGYRRTLLATRCRSPAASAATATK